VNRIASSASIDKDVQLGDNNTIGEQVIIRAGSIIGNNNTIEPFAKIGPHTHLGDDNFIDFQACLGGNPQVVGLRGIKSFLRIGNRNTFREFCTANRSRTKGGSTLVGDDNYLMSYAHLGHDVKLGNGCILSSYAGLSGHVEVMEYAVLGGMAGVHQYCRIGPYAMVSGLAKVTKDLPPFCLAEGRPAKVIGINSEGLKRHDYSAQQRRQIKKIYDEFYGCGLPYSKAAKRLAEIFPHDEHADLLLDFFNKSQRGLMRRGRAR
jgi:UDP-N-acetylglucosamine acyltransferase